MRTKNLPGYEALREVRGLDKVIRLPHLFFSERDGRTPEEWCYADEELETYAFTTDSSDSSRKVESMFSKLEEAMKRPQTKAIKSGLAAKNKKTPLLGGKKEIFKKPEEDHLAASTKQYMAGLPDARDKYSCICDGNKGHHIWCPCSRAVAER